MESNVSVQKETCLMKGEGYCPKPLESVSAFLSKKWTISIIVTLGNFKSVRFNGLLNRLGVTAKTLASRLKELEKERLVLRSAFPEIPPRVEYSLTKEGAKLRKSILPLINWASHRS